MTGDPGVVDREGFGGGGPARAEPPPRASGTHKWSRRIDGPNPRVGMGIGPRAVSSRDTDTVRYRAGER